METEGLAGSKVMIHWDTSVAREASAHEIREWKASLPLAPEGFWNRLFAPARPKRPEDFVKPVVDRLRTTSHLGREWDLRDWGVGSVNAQALFIAHLAGQDDDVQNALDRTEALKNLSETEVRQRLLEAGHLDKKKLEFQGYSKERAVRETQANYQRRTEKVAAIREVLDASRT